MASSLANYTKDANKALTTTTMNLNTAIQNAGQNAQNTVSNGGQSAIGTLSDYGNSALSALNTSYNNASGYGQDALTALENSYNSAKSNLSGIESLYTPYANSGSAASTMYSNALGLNGADGNAAATSAYQASPGYQWSVDEALGQTTRQANASGLAVSGNVLTAMEDRANNLASQDFDRWLAGLANQQSVGLQATDGIANARSALSALDTNYGNSRAAQYNSLADLESAYGGNQASVLSALGNSISGVQTNTANTLAGLETGMVDDIVNNSQWGVGNVANNLVNLGAGKQSIKQANQQSIVNGLGKLSSLLTGNLSGSLLGSLTGIGGLTSSAAPASSYEAAMKPGTLY